MWPRIRVTKKRELDRVMRRKYVRMGQKKRNLSPAHFCCVYWSVGCCTSQSSITISTPGTWRYKKCVLWPKKKNSQPHYARIVERSTGWWHATRATYPAAASCRIIESTDWRHFNKCYVCHWWGLYCYCVPGTSYIIANMHYLSTTTTYDNNNIKCPNTLTTPTYQVPGTSQPW